MTKKTTRRPADRRRRHLRTRLELSRILPASLTQVDRLIALGLKPAASRGRAKLYRLSEARRLVQRNTRETENTNLIALADAKARRVRSDLARFAGRHVRPADAAAQWQVLVGHVRAAVTAMVAALARRLAALPAAPAPTPGPPRDRRFLTPDQVRALLDDPASPLRPVARPAITALAARGIGLELLSGGRWYPWSPGAETSRPASDPIPIVINTSVRELLTSLATTTPAASKPAPPLPRVKPSPSLRAARSQAAYFQVRLVELRDAIANHAVILRDDVIRDGQTRVIACRTRMLALARVAARAGSDPTAIMTALRRAVDLSLSELEPRRNERSKTA
jgi:hypothetical protein